jgi:FlaA1/EpsC-like NDP-sugar epimerase
MRKLYKNSKIKFYIGDVRDPQSVLNAVRGANYIFHAAALKQVPSYEFYPLEAVKTNVLGTENVFIRLEKLMQKFPLWKLRSFCLKYCQTIKQGLCI